MIFFFFFFICSVIRLIEQFLKENNLLRTLQTLQVILRYINN